VWKPSFSSGNYFAIFCRTSKQTTLTWQEISGKKLSDFAIFWVAPQAACLWGNQTTLTWQEISGKKLSE